MSAAGFSNPLLRIFRRSGQAVRRRLIGSGTSRIQESDPTNDPAIAVIAQAIVPGSP